MVTSASRCLLTSMALYTVLHHCATQPLTACVTHKLHACYTQSYHKLHYLLWLLHTLQQRMACLTLILLVTHCAFPFCVTPCVTHCITHLHKCYTACYIAIMSYFLGCCNLLSTTALPETAAIHSSHYFRTARRERGGTARRERGAVRDREAAAEDYRV